MNLRPYFVFTFEPAELIARNMLYNRYEASSVRPGFPTESEMRTAFSNGYRYCNLFWLTPGFTTEVLDYLDLAKYFYSR